MGKIDIFKTAKREHEDSVDIVTEAKKSGNSFLVHYARVTKIYSEIGFSFNNKRGSEHKYENNKRLTQYIGEACNELKGLILERALKLSEKNVESKRLAAKEEAEEVLKLTDKGL